MEAPLKPVRHRLVQTGNATLIIDKDPAWVIPMACLSVAFYADPAEVLKYGSNGLHFAEHILWNMIARDTLRQTNASTFNTGEMAVYGTCLEDEFQEALSSFFGGLIRMATRKVSAELKSVFKIEQRRVTCETEFMSESSYRGRVESRMFVYNTDMTRSQYSPDYVWKILLEECSLGRVIIMAHCNVDEASVQLFERLAGEFTAAWRSRARNAPKKVLLPSYYAPPYSLLSRRPNDRVSSLVRFDDAINPIERLIIQSKADPWSGPYLFAVSASEEGLSNLATEKESKYALQWACDWSDPFFAVPMLSSHAGPIEETWVRDLYSKTPKELIKKYRRAAVDKFLASIAGRS